MTARPERNGIRALGVALPLALILWVHLGLGFIIPGISWEAHVGGLLAGAAIAGVLLATRERRQRGLQIAGIAGIAVLLVATTVATVLIR